MQRRSWNTDCCLTWIFVTFCFAAFTLTPKALADEPPPTRLIIYHDGGGVLQDRLEKIDAFRAHGTQIEIRGTCKSACTLYLVLDTVCVSTDAALGFHGPRYADGSPMPKDRFEHWTEILARHYPTSIGKWFLETGRHITGGNQFLMMTGADIIAHGVSSCLPIEP